MRVADQRDRRVAWLEHGSGDLNAIAIVEDADEAIASDLVRAL
jgi:hypothetical protein